MFLISQGKNRAVQNFYVKEFSINKYKDNAQQQEVYCIIATYTDGNTAVLRRASSYADAQKCLLELVQNIGEPFSICGGVEPSTTKN